MPGWMRDQAAVPTTHSEPCSPAWGLGMDSSGRAMAAGFRPWEVPSEAALEERIRQREVWSVELATGCGGAGGDGILTLKTGSGDATGAPQRPMVGLHQLPGASVEEGDF